MIPISSSARIWIAMGHTDMRKGMRSLALQVQHGLNHDVHAGDLYVFRERSGSLCKILWHDGVGMSLFGVRLRAGRISPASLLGWLTAPGLAELDRLGGAASYEILREI